MVKKCKNTKYEIKCSCLKSWNGICIQFLLQWHDLLWSSMRKIKWQRTLCIKNWWKTPEQKQAWIQVDCGGQSWNSIANTVNLQCHGKLNYIWPELRAYSLSRMWWDKREGLKWEENNRTKLSLKAVGKNKQKEQFDSQSNDFYESISMVNHSTARANSSRVKSAWWIAHWMNSLNPSEQFPNQHLTHLLNSQSCETLIRKITDWLFIWQCAVKYKDLK